MPPNAHFKKISSPLKPPEYFQSIPQTNSFPNCDMLAHLYPTARPFMTSETRYQLATVCHNHCKPISMYSFTIRNLIISTSKLYWQWLLKMWWLLKEPLVWCAAVRSNRQIRTEYVPGVWVRTPHPWRSQSCAWRARCRSQHHGSHSQGKLWEHHESLRRSGQRFA